ncbi:class I SAM-dependent methyltransferase [Anoxybacter fermentans]|nr:class I SAM-dependent methyltransferase [Anoxybacter fermentans]
MPRFETIFAKWAANYDDTVLKNPGEYHEVFEGYTRILATIVEKLKQPKKGKVIDIGTGTGNLAGFLIKAGFQVMAIEPSKEMRKIAKRKFPELEIYEGDFLNFPEKLRKVHGIVSSYAFHHLTDEEKADAIRNFNQHLVMGGQVIFADTVYENLKFKEELLRDTKARGYMGLLKDLKREYYTTIDVLKNQFTAAGFEVEFTRMNKFVWIMDAKKIKEVEN